MTERTQAEIDDLGEQIAELSAHIQAATYRLLVLIREFDEAEGWHRAGFTSCGRWLSWRTGVGPGAAREKVRVARALADLPGLSDALRRGELSYSVARALTRVATPETEAELVEVARHSTAAQMEKLVSAWRATDRAGEAAAARERERHRGRELSLVEDASDGSWVVRGRLDPEVGAALGKALEAAADELYAGEGPPEDDEDADRPYAARRADALGVVAEAALGGGLGEPAARADRYQVVVHVSAETLAGAEDVSAETPEAGREDPPRLEGGPALPPETARRLGCDASVVGMVEDREGEALDVGRRRRSVPTPTRRALAARDGGTCRFPGCGTRFTEAHHVVSWAEGGATSVENLLLLCRRHHRRVHEGGWRVERTSEGEGQTVRFLRPDGRELPAVPPGAAVPEDPVDTLVRDQRELGIGPGTATPDWDGTRMEVDWAISVLHPRAREMAAVSAETGYGAETRPAGSDSGVPSPGRP